MPSIIMPVDNEARTLGEIIERVRKVPIALARELIVVDDASRDGTLDVRKKIAAAPPDEIRVFSHEWNRGKGAAIRTGISHARGQSS